jgi:predicted DNA binding CopG/RHH family protein
MKAKNETIPVSTTEDEEADLWSSPAGRALVKKNAAKSAAQKRLQGPPLVSTLNKSSSVQIALRLPESDLAVARRIAAHKAIGYQTLLKMLVHEGLEREAQRR